LVLEFLFQTNIKLFLNHFEYFKEGEKKKEREMERTRQRTSILVDTVVAKKFV
jgi:hypothetical protein